MELDIWIVTGAAITQLVITIYGIYESVIENRKRRAFIIGLIGAVGIVLTVWGAFRNDSVQTAVKRRRDGLQKSVDKPQPAPVANVPPTVVNVSSQQSRVTMVSQNLVKFLIGDHVEANFLTKNLSQDIPSEGEFGFARLYVVEAQPIGLHGEWMGNP